MGTRADPPPCRSQAESLSRGRKRLASPRRTVSSRLSYSRRRARFRFESGRSPLSQAAGPGLASKTGSERLRPAAGISVRVAGGLSPLSLGRLTTARQSARGRVSLLPVASRSRAPPIEIQSVQYQTPSPRSHVVEIPRLPRRSIKWSAATESVE